MCVCSLSECTCGQLLWLPPPRHVPCTRPCHAHEAVHKHAFGESPHLYLPVPLPAVNCPKCSYHQAYFMEIQIRSADEPATLFFKCVQCAHRWREG